MKMDTLEKLKAKMAELSASKQSTVTVVEELEQPTANDIIEESPIHEGIAADKTESPVEPQLIQEVIQDDNLIECECCPNLVKEVDIKKFHSMKMCPSCYEKELLLQSQNTTPEKQEERVELANKSIEHIRMVDQQVQLRQDIFNNETIAIHTIVEMVNGDDSIPNDKKAFSVGKAIKDRIEHFQKVIFDLTELQVQENNKLRASITYFNELQYKLRAEERELLKLSDLNYKPTTPKLVTPKEKSASTGRKGPRKVNMTLLKESSAKLAIWCMENGYKIMTMDAVQMISSARNMSPDDAVELIKKTPGMLTKNN